MTGNEIQFCLYVSSLNWAAGRTKHDQTYNCFLRAASLRIDPQKAFASVVAKIEAAGGNLIPLQVQRQLQRAYEYVAGNGWPEYAPDLRPKTKKRSKATFRPEELKRIASKAALDDPVSFIRYKSVLPPESVTSHDFLNMLYRPGEKVIVFTKTKSQGQVVFEIGAPAEQSLPTEGPNGVWFLTNPVDGEFRPNPRQDNELSRRSAESITAWRYLLLESDEADDRDWMAVLVQLPLPIVAIYTSGVRSIHALVRVDALNKEDWDAKKDMLKDTVVTLGACPPSLSAVRLSRLPQCKRGENWQELLYINPAADGTPILGQKSGSEGQQIKSNIATKKEAAHE